MKAMILAAGEGTRLRPMTYSIPKVLAPIGTTPLLKYIIHWLKIYGINEIAINLHYLGDKIQNFLGDGSKFGVKIVFSKEEVPLGTAGGVKKMEHFFEDTFAVVYGDVLTNLNLASMIEFHKKKGGLATLSVHIISGAEASSQVDLNEDSQVIRFTEKPSIREPAEALVNAGVYILQKELLSYIPSDTYCDFGYHVFPHLLSTGIPFYGYLLRDNEYLIDIGNWGQYQKANKYAREGKIGAMA